VQDLFWPDRPALGPRINWSQQRYFHGVHKKEEGTIRWFVALSGSYLPRHALCYNYVAKQWWIEEYPFYLGASTALTLPVERPIVAGPARRVYSLAGVLDGLRPDQGSNRGTATAATLTSLTDAQANFNAQCVGAPVSIVDGRGKAQTRIIAAASLTRLTVDRPWAVVPDATSVYQVGAINYQWRSGWMSFVKREEAVERKASLAFEPANSAAQMDLRVYRDKGLLPYAWALDWPPTPTETDYVTIRNNSPDVVIDLTQPAGFAMVRLDEGETLQVQRADSVALELRGYGGASPLRYYSLELEGATP
jgi:hypothetical protein